MGPGQDHDNLNELLEMKGKVNKVKGKRRGHPHQLVMKHSRTRLRQSFQQKSGRILG